MRAAVTTEEHGFDVVEMPDPTPGRDLLIRVGACGVCGSDIKAQPLMPAGMIMGHEIGGEVVGVGRGTNGWLVGVNVAVLPVVSCGGCRYCAAGLVTHCQQSNYLGMGLPGGFAEFAVVPARHAFVVTSHLPESYAALVELFAVGLHGISTFGIRPDEDVVIVGAGGVGVTTVAWARAKGARRITIVDPDAGVGPPGRWARPMNWRRSRTRMPKRMTR